jgi:hypothetical protein
LDVFHDDADGARLFVFVEAVCTLPGLAR